MPSVWRNNAFKGIPGSSEAKTRSSKKGERSTYLADPVMKYVDSGDSGSSETEHFGGRRMYADHAARIHRRVARGTTSRHSIFSTTSKKSKRVVLLQIPGLVQ